MRGETKVNRDVVEGGSDVRDLTIEAREWRRVTGLVAVDADMKGSTSFSIHAHAASTAAIYETAPGRGSRVLDDFDADFVAIQGDGLFGLFWGERRYEGAVCAGITLQDLQSEASSPQLSRKRSDMPATGSLVGVTASSLLVKLLGVPRTEYQEPGNYAFKCAQQANTDEMIVPNSVWDFAKASAYLAVSCPCVRG